MENNTSQENEASTGSAEMERGSRFQEAVSVNVGSGTKWEPVQTTPVPVQAPGYPIAQSMYPPGPMGPTGSQVPGQVYTLLPYPPTRTVSSASCLQRTGTPNLGVEVYPPMATRSYSFDGGVNFQQTVNSNGVHFSNYQKLSEMHDPAAGLYCSTGGGQFGEYGFQSVHSQGSLPVVGADCTNLEGFAHLEIIKDLLE